MLTERTSYPRWRVNPRCRASGDVYLTRDEWASPKASICHGSSNRACATQKVAPRAPVGITFIQRTRRSPPHSRETSGSWRPESERRDVLWHVSIEIHSEFGGVTVCRRNP